MKTPTNKTFNKERRQNISSSLPMKDRKGNLIVRERRHVAPDYRVGGLELTSVELSQKEFQAFFNQFDKDE